MEPTETVVTTQDVSGPLRRPGPLHQRCTAQSKRKKQRCGKDAIAGATVCRFHGGAAPQVQRAARRRLELAHITPDRTLLEIARIAYGDIASFFNEDGTLKKPHQLDEDQRATLASFEACIKNTEAGDGKQDLIHKFKAWDKTKALEMLAKHFGLIQEKVQHQGEISIKWQDDDTTISCEVLPDNGATCRVLGTGEEKP